MNFAQVRTLKNQKDEKNYPVRLEMFATINEIGSSQLTQNQKSFCKIKLIDDMNEKHNVTIYGDVPAINLLNTRQVFTLSAFDGNYQGKPYVGYSGFWQNTQAVPPPPRSPQPAQQPYTPPPEAPVDTTRLSIERQCAWKGACRIAAASPEMDLKMVIDCARAGHYFITTGDNQCDLPEWNPESEPTGEPPDDTPF